MNVIDLRKTIKKNSKRILIALSAVIVLAMVWEIFGAPNAIIQPINYNHKLHIEKAKLTCVDCHLFVETMAAATIPNIEVCSDCHSGEPLSKSPEEVKLLKYIESGKRIPWEKIYSVPAHVYFSHRRHVTIGEIKCIQCHGNVQELTEPASHPLWLATMKNCIKCHKENKVTYDCLACHH